MPHKTEWKHNGVVINFFGTLKAQEVLEINSILYGDSRFEEMEYQLFDFLEVKELIASNIDAKVIGTLDKQASIWNNHIKGALITTNPRLIELISIYTDVIKDTNWQVKIFNDLESANEWIRS